VGAPRRPRSVPCRDSPRPHGPPLDPSDSTAPQGRPPPAAGWSIPALTVLLGDVAPAGAAVRVAGIVVLLLLAGAAALAEAAAFGNAPAGKDAPARAGALRARGRPSLVALLLLNALALAGAGLLAAPLATAGARATGVATAPALIVLAVLLAVAWLALGVAVPRALAARGAGAHAALAAIAPLVRALRPLATALAGALDRVHARPRPPAEPISADDVRSMAGGNGDDELYGEEEAALIHSILEFGETTVREVMVGRVDIVALPITATLDDALGLVRQSGHSRLPLYAGDLDEIRGIVHAKDLLPLAGPDRKTNGDVDWQTLARRARFVPPGRNLDDLLSDLRLHRTHIAIVVDEYGGTLGLVSLEDLLEEVVGEIRDELDEPDDEPRLVPAGPDTFSADARLHLDDFFEGLGMKVDTDAFGFETVGGLVFHLAGAVPDEGDEVTFQNLLIRVETLDANRIREVRVQVGPATPDAGHRGQ